MTETPGVPMARIARFELMQGPMDGETVLRWDNEITHTFTENTPDGMRYHIYTRRDKLARLYYVKTERDGVKGGRK